MFQKFYKMDIDKDKTFPKDRFYRLMILCLDLYKGVRDKKSNTIYSTIKKGFFYYIGTTQSKFDVLKKQILIEVANKLENIDPQELFDRFQTKKVNDKYMTDIDLDDLYGKALGAVKKHWEQKYVMSEEEKKHLHNS